MEEEIGLLEVRVGAGEAELGGEEGGVESRYLIRRAGHWSVRP
jgi:hypothetical protein